MLNPLNFNRKERSIFTLGIAKIDQTLKVMVEFHEFERNGFRWTLGDVHNGDVTVFDFQMLLEQMACFVGRESELHSWLLVVGYGFCVLLRWRNNS